MQAGGVVKRIGYKNIECFLEPKAFLTSGEKKNTVKKISYRFQQPRCKVVKTQKWNRVKP